MPGVRGLRNRNERLAAYLMPTSPASADGTVVDTQNSVLCSLSLPSLLYPTLPQSAYTTLGTHSSESSTSSSESKQKRVKHKSKTHNGQSQLNKDTEKIFRAVLPSRSQPTPNFRDITIRIPPHHLLIISLTQALAQPNPRIFSFRGCLLAASASFQASLRYRAPGRCKRSMRTLISTIPSDCSGSEL
jgi:hypothetical protein